MPTESLSRPITEQRSTFRQRVFAHRLWIGLAVVGGAAFIVRPRALFGEYKRRVPISVGGSYRTALRRGGDVRANYREATMALRVS